MGRQRAATLIPEPFSQQPVQHLCIEGQPRKISWKNPLGLPTPLTWHQCFYIFVIQGLGAACIDGGANFGIATIGPGKRITMWILAENTIAGDVGVTVFIQGILTFVIASGFVHVDMRHRGVDAFPYPWPDTQFAVVKGGDPEAATSRRSKLWRTFHQRHGLGRGLHFFSGSHVNDVFNLDLTWKQFLVRLFWSVWKGSVLSALFFLVFWPITIACIAPRWGGRDMAGTWAPEIIKLVFGFLLGLFMNPLCAMIALGSEDSVRQHRREVHLENLKQMEEAPPAPITMAERAGRPLSTHVHG
ncbi:hypothetical protein JCM3765_000077 [Sporobolomyces pararoseus]